MDSHGGRLGYKYIPAQSSAACGVRCLEDGNCYAVAVTEKDGSYMCTLYEEGMAYENYQAGSTLMMKTCKEGEII